MVGLSSEKYIVSTGHRYSWYQQRRYSEDGVSSFSVHRKKSKNVLQRDFSGLVSALNDHKSKFNFHKKQYYPYARDIKLTKI